jgi:hypothetical protein
VIEGTMIVVPMTLFIWDFLNLGWMQELLFQKVIDFEGDCCMKGLRTDVINGRPWSWGKVRSLDSVPKVLDGKSFSMVVGIWCRSA